MRTRTKVVCTIGPAVKDYEKILALIDAGMNVARLNFSHGTHKEHLEVIKNLKKARAERKVPLAIMLDTKGPEIRVGKIANDAVALKASQRLELVKENVVGDDKRICITPLFVVDDLKIGQTVLFDDGTIIAKVVDRGVLEIQNEGVLKTQKGVNIPNAHIDLPAMTAQDIKDVVFGCEQDVDLIAASFIRSADHVCEFKKLLAEQGKEDILVIAKIENSQGVQNFDSIVQAADGIMVARGDLGVELPLTQVPNLQKMMIRKSYEACKPVIVATQMLESMIKNPRPTRAEVSDVANAIYDSASAVMLSGETAVGLYPIETVKMMKNIIYEAEKEFNYRDFFELNSKEDYFNDISSSVALATVKTAYSAKAKAIFSFTSSGFTARIISRFRPDMPIVALTSNSKVYHQLAHNWGVIPVEVRKVKDIDEAFEILSKEALSKGIVHPQDIVIATSGIPFGVRGTTNTMIVKVIASS